MFFFLVKCFFLFYFFFFFKDVLISGKCSFSAFIVTNFIMKAFINGRKLFGTPFCPLQGTEVVRHSPSNLSTNKPLDSGRLCFPRELPNMNAVSFVLSCRTTSLTPRCWRMGSWRPMTGAAEFAGRLDTTWRTVQKDAGCPPFPQLNVCCSNRIPTLRENQWEVINILCNYFPLSNSLSF